MNGGLRRNRPLIQRQDGAKIFVRNGFKGSSTIYKFAAKWVQLILDVISLLWMYLGFKGLPVERQINKQFVYP